MTTTVGDTAQLLDVMAGPDPRDRTCLPAPTVRYAEAIKVALVRDRAASGAAVLVCSSDAEELIEVCDRILIMRNGMVAGELPGGPQLSEGSITHACQAA